jgi:flagellar hook-associated protein 2
MAGLSSPGLGSGLDVNSIVTQLMTLEQRPITTLNTKEASFQAKLTAYGSLKGALAAVQSAVEVLTLATTFTSRTAAVSDTTILAASAGTTAAAGSYAVEVTQLAKYHAVRSNTNYTATTETLNTGTLAIRVGVGVTANIAIDSSNNTLAGLRDTINDAGAGVTATIINTGSTNRLVLTSNTLGSAGAIDVTVTEDGIGGPYDHALTDLKSTGVGTILVETQAADDAGFKINNIAITRSSNTVTDAIEGVTLNLTKLGTASVTISKNSSAVTGTINAFVKTYNDAVKQLQSASSYDAVNKRASILTGDNTVRNIGTGLRTLVQATVSGIGGGIAALSDIGIALQKDGTLVVNSTKLSAALADPDTDVASLFASTATDNKGIAVRFNEALGSIVGSSGLIVSRTDGIAASIKDIGRRRDVLTARLSQIEARYRAQFSALDSLVAGMNKTSQFLTQQLANLPATSNK